MIGQPWNRQPGESDAAWEAFTVYRKVRPRTLKRVALECTKSYSLIKRWSAAHQWAERADAMDAHSNQSWLDSLRDERTKVAKEQAEAARRIRKRLEAHLEEASIGVTFDKGVASLAALARIESDALGAGRAVLHDEDSEESRPPVVVITGADDLS